MGLDVKGDEIARQHRISDWFLTFFSNFQKTEVWKPPTTIQREFVIEIRFWRCLCPDSHTTTTATQELWWNVSAHDHHDWCWFNFPLHLGLNFQVRSLGTWAYTLSTIRTWFQRVLAHSGCAHFNWIFPSVFPVGLQEGVSPPVARQLLQAVGMWWARKHTHQTLWQANRFCKQRGLCTLPSRLEKTTLSPLLNACQGSRR